MDFDNIYMGLLSDILAKGSVVKTRNSVTKRLTSLRAEFTSTPLVSIRKTAWRSALREFEWFMSGSSNIKDLHPSVHKWWQPWADENGEIKNNYSKQFRHYTSVRQEPNGVLIPVEVDQIQLLVDGIRDHPYSRRNAISTWNTADMVQTDTPITNCHGTLIQATVDPEDNGLEIHMMQRSADVVLGLQHNWIQYWGFLLWLCAKTGRNPKRFVWMGIDCHIYEEHFELVEKLKKQFYLDPSGGVVLPIQTPNLVYNWTEGTPFTADSFTLDGEYRPVNTDPAKMIV